MRSPTLPLRLAASTALAALLVPGVAWGQAALPVPAGLPLPGGPLDAVVAGNATIRSDSSRLDVDLNSTSSVINWASFNIGRTQAGPNVVSFNNKTAGTAAVLNRVVGLTETRITGQLISDSNVSVYLVNPNGITIGSGADVNVGALIASTLNLNTDAFTNAAGSTLPGASLRFAGLANGRNGITLDGGSINTLKGLGSGLGQLVLLGAFVGRPTDGAASAGQAAATQTAGSDLAFVAGTDITMTRAAGSPLAFTITRGTRLENAIHADGTLNGQSVTLAMASADSVQDAVLNVSGTVTASVAVGTSRGIVLAAGNVSASDISFGTDNVSGAVTAEVSGSLNSPNPGGGVVLQSSLAARVQGSIDASRVRIGGRAVALGNGPNPAEISATGAVDIGAGAGGITASAGTRITANAGNDPSAGPLTLQALAGGAITLSSGSQLRGGSNRSSDVLIYAPDEATDLQLGNVDARGLYATDTGRVARNAISRTGALTLGDVFVTAPLSLSAAGITANALSSSGTLALGGSGPIRATSLTATGALTVNGSGALEVSGATTAQGSIGDILIDRTGALTLNSIAAGRNVSIGQSTAAASVLLNGTASAGGDFRVNTTGAQTYNGGLTLNGTSALTSRAVGDIRFVSTVDGATALTVNTAGATRFEGAVGGSAPLASITTDAAGTTELRRSITTIGAQSFNDAVTLGGNVTLTGTVPTFGATIAGNGNDLALNFSGATTIDGAAFTGIRTLSTGAGGTTTLRGAITTSGAQSYADAVTLGANTVLNAGASPIDFGGTLDSDGTARTLAVARTVTFGGAVGGLSRLASLTAGGSALIAGGAVNTTGAQSYDGPVRIGADTTLDAGSAAITFAGTIDSVSSPNGLTLNTSGATLFGGAVGGNNALASLTTSAGGTTAVNGGAITTTAAQTYGDALVLGANTILTGSVPSLATVAGNGFDLALNFSGTTAIDGGFAGIRNLTTGNGGTTSLQGNITTTGLQSYADAVVLTGDTVLNAGAAGVGFGGTLDSAGAARALKVNTPGTASFGGAVGNGAAGAIASLTANAGAIAINGGAITTVGAQAYGGGVTLGADAVLTGTSGSLPSVAGNGFDLALNFSGLTAIDGRFTGIRNLSTGGGGTTSLQGVIATTGAQSYGDAVLLAANTMLSGTTPVFGSTVTGRGFDLSLDFSGPTTIDGGFTGIRNLATGGGGTTSLQGAITTTGTQSYADAVLLGADSVLSGTTATFGSTVEGRGFDLALDFGGATAINGGVTGIRNLTTRGGGTTALQGAITTTGTQTYGDAVLLTGDTILSAGDNAIGFAGTVDGGSALTVNSSAGTMFGGVIGGAQALGSLSTDAAGATSINGGSVTTTGAQAYGDAVTLGADTVLSGESVSFGRTVDGARTLLVNARGLTRFGGAVGATQRLTSLATDAGGSTLLSGGRVSTSGAQTYGDAVVLGSDMAIDAGGGIRFAGTIDGGFALAANSAGPTVFGGAVGGTERLASLTTDGVGTTAINGGFVATTGAQSYNDAAMLGAATVLNGGAITFARTLDGGYALTANSGGVTRFVGAVGGAQALTSLATDAAGTTAIDGGAITTTGTQTFADTITLGADTVLTAASGSLAAVDGGGRALRILYPGGARIGGNVAGVTMLAIRGEGIDLSGQTVRTENATLDAGGGALAAGTLDIANTLVGNGASLSIGSAAARTGSLALRATAGGLTLGSGRAGTTATLTARDAVSIGAAGTGLSARTITVASNDISLAGAITADSVTLTNTGAGRLRLGSAGGSGYALDEAELRTLATPSLTIDNKAGDIAIGDAALADATGSTNLFLATTGRLDVTGRLSGSSAGGATPAPDAPLRTIRLGGSTSDADAIASTIAVVATPTAGGRLIFAGNTAIDLRATRVGVGQEAGFLASLGLMPGTATPLPTATVLRDFVGNPNSALYNAAIGGAAYVDTTVVRANTLSVRFGEYGLFQNTARPGGAPATSGVDLQSQRLPTVQATVLGNNAGATSDNGFALFGTVNDQSGSGTASLGGQTLALDGVNPNNARVNGCLVNSGSGGCLISTVTTPQLQIFDRSQANILRTADDLALAFDPVIGTNNESLFSDVGAIDLPGDLPADGPAQCDPATNSGCPTNGARAQ